MAMAEISGSGALDPETSEREAVSTETRTLLTVLRAPKASELSRKRKVASNPPSGKKTCQGTVASEPSNVSVHDPIKQFPDEPLTVNFSNKLFCKACRETLSLKKSIITAHIKSSKHSAGVIKLKTKKEKERESLCRLYRILLEAHLETA